MRKINNMFRYRNSKEHPRLIAHRGYTPVAPENSLPSFEAAGKHGFWAIETDVHKTKDGYLVCCHNSSTEKMFGKDIIIEEATLLELSKLKFVCGNNVKDVYSDDEMRIPFYSQYIAICKRYGAIPFVESKAQIAEEIIDVLKKEELIDFSVFSSIDFSHIEEAMSVSDRIFVHHIFSNDECMRRLAERGKCGLSYNYPDLSLLPVGLIEHTHNYGVKVCLRAGDTVERCHEMLALGLDYIPTNKIYEI